MDVMTPEEFAAKMRELDAIAGNDPDFGSPMSAHEDADALMMSVLRSLGYGEGVEIFDNMFKWYA